jgi:hypothetical protein
VDGAGSQTPVVQPVACRYTRLTLILGTIGISLSVMGYSTYSMHGLTTETVDYFMF